MKGRKEGEKEKREKEKGREEKGLGTVAHTYNPSTLGGLGGRLLEARGFRPGWATWPNCLY